MKVKVAESVNILNLLSIVDDWLLNLRCHDIQNVSDHFQNLTNSSPVHSLQYRNPSHQFRINPLLYNFCPETEKQTAKQTERRSTQYSTRAEVVAVITQKKRCWAKTIERDCWMTMAVIRIRWRRPLWRREWRRCLELSPVSSSSQFACCLCHCRLFQVFQVLSLLPCTVWLCFLHASSARW